VELTPLAQRRPIIDLVQLTRALAHPGDRMAWLSVLRAPWCGLTLASLTHLFGDDHVTPVPVLIARALGSGDAACALTPDERLRLARVANILLDTANDAGALPFAAWVEQVWQRLGGACVYEDTAHTTDAQRFFQLLERIAPYGALDTARLAAELQRLYAAPNVAAHVENPVDVMTMHKAKGLQFDVVILYGLHRAPRTSTAPLVRFEQNSRRVLMAPIKPRADSDADPLSAYLAAREQARADFELDRLLYVAATRARARLHLLGAVAPDKKTGAARPPANTTLLGRLWPHLASSLADPTPTGAPAPANTADPAAPQLAGGLLRRVRVAGFTEDFTEGFTDNLPAPATARPAAQTATPPFQLLHPDVHDDATGTVAHAWLARIGADGLTAWPQETLPASVPRIRRQLARAGVPDAHLDACAAVVLDTLTATLRSERGRWLLGLAHARREWPLVDIAGKVSVIDLAVEQDHGWLVVDYKTTRPHPDELPEAFAHRMRTRHAAQLARYCQHVTQLDKRPARGALYFPRADVWVELP